MSSIDIVRKQCPGMVERFADLAQSFYSTEMTHVKVLELFECVYDEVDEYLGNYPADAVFIASEPAFKAALDGLAALKKHLDANGAKSEQTEKVVNQLAELLGEQSSKVRTKMGAALASRQASHHECKGFGCKVCYPHGRF